MSAGADGTVRTWEVGTGTELPRKGITSSFDDPVAFSPDGKWLVFGTAKTSIPNVWDGSKLTLCGLEARRSVPLEAGSLFNEAEFSWDGKMIAARGKDEICLLEVPTGKRVHRLKRDPNESYSSSYVFSGGIAFSPDGSTLASMTDEYVQFHDLETGRRAWRFWRAEPDESLTWVAFSPDGRSVAVGCGATVRLLDTNTKRQTKTVGARPINQIVFDPDGKILASEWYGTIRLWDVASGKELLSELSRRGHRVGVVLVAFCPDGRKLVTAEGHYGRVHVWDLRTARQTLDWDLRGLGGRKRSFAVGGAVVAVGLGESNVELWSADTGRKLGTIEDDFIDTIYSLAVSPDGKLLAVGGQWGSGVSVWDVDSRRKCYEIDLSRERHSSVHTVRFSQDGKVLAFRYFGHVGVYESATGKLLMASKVNDGSFLAYDVALATDGTIVASVDMNAGIGLWSVATGKRLRRIEGQDAVASLALSIDGRHIASGGGSRGDFTVRVWDVATGAEVARLKGHGWTVTSVAFSPDGKLLASGSTDTTALVWDWEKIRRAYESTAGASSRDPARDRTTADD